MRTVGGLVNLRSKAVFEAVKEALDWTSVSRGTKGLCVRLARLINRRMGRTGRVFAHRYDAHVLRSPREVRNALVYVLNNAKKHAREAGTVIPRGWLDPYSSATTFDGWDREIVALASADPPAVAKASVWLLTTGWRRHGRLSVDEMPGMRK